MSESPARGALASAGAAALLAACVAGPLALLTWAGGVGFATPSGLWLGGLALPLLLLYLLKARRPRLTVSSLLFWRPVALEQQSGSPFRRLRRSLVLLLQLAALGCLTYALARPAVLAAAGDATALVVVLDTSASMLARDHDGRTRFAAAQDAARALVDGLGPLDEATVIAADRTAWTVVPWTDDAGALRRGIDALEARHCGTALYEGLILAAAAARAGRGAPEVHLLSDGGGPPPPPVVLGGPLVYHRFGTTGENVGVVAVRAEPRSAASELAGAREGEGVAYAVLARLRNAGAARRAVFACLEAGGRTLAVRRVDLEGGADLVVTLEARLAPGPVAVRLLPADAPPPLDALPVDDAAHALVAADPGVAAALVTREESPAVARALAAAGARVRALAPGAPLDDPALRLVVCDGVLPATLPPCDCLLLAPPAGVGPVTLGARVERPRLAAWDRDDPLLRYVELDDVEVLAATPLELGAGARALVQGEQGGVLVAAWQDGPCRRTVVGFDVYESTWPLRASFPILVRNAVVLAARRDELARGSLRAGDPLAVPIGPDVHEVTLELPDGRVAPVRTAGGQAYLARTDIVGVYTLRAGAREERLCVNLLDPDESRIEPRRTFVLGDAAAADAVDRRRPREVGRWLVLAALALLTLEAWAYHRRW